tara:strand:+ start:80 stop:391 length:312 start_codon:yes stop_codon:yes gene_type:complete
MSVEYEREVARKLKVYDDYRDLSHGQIKSMMNHGEVIRKWLDDDESIIQYKNSFDMDWVDLVSQDRPHFHAECNYRIKPVVKKLTVNDIQALLGYDIEIVGGW